MQHDGVWYDCDDWRVDKMEVNDINKRAAYVLIYRKLDPNATSSGIKNCEADASPSTDDGNPSEAEKSSAAAKPQDADEAKPGTVGGPLDVPN